MPNKKINALDVRTAVATDLMLVGDPSTGTAYKSTLATLPLVPNSRTITINGVAFDLSANRAWTIGTVTSVGLSMPSAFTVGSSPITSSGTIAVTGTGTTLQYVDGTGALQTFPTIMQASDIIAEVRNQSGATMTKGTIVYISGATGNKPLISKALATGDSTSAQTFGIVQADIANNGVGYIVIIGNITDLDTSALTEGQQLYLSGTTAGTWTTTKPYAPIHLVYVGIVIRSHPTQGTISVKVMNGFEMDELHNVSAQSPANNDGLFWNSSTNLWSKNTIGGVLGYTPQAALTLTTTGTSGAATLVGATLNIPQYSGGGSMAIGGAITSATAGSVLFAGTSGVLQQDNANLFWDDTNNRLGIGTATPALSLDVIGEGRFNGIYFGKGVNTLNNIRISTASNALTNVTTGTGNVVVGNGGQSITSGVNNFMLGSDAAFRINSGSSNISIGAESLLYVTTHSNNIGIGNRAGAYQTGYNNLTPTSCIYIGNNCFSGALSPTNEIVIGNGTSTIGLGSNTTIIGNSSTITTALRGRLLLGTTTDSGLYQLDVNGTARVSGKLTITAGTTAASQINLASSTAPTSPNNGDIWFDGTDLKMRIGGVTKTFTLV